jgi:hypothetical protein
MIASLNHTRSGRRVSAHLLAGAAYTQRLNDGRMGIIISLQASSRERGRQRATGPRRVADAIPPHVAERVAGRPILSMAFPASHCPHVYVRLEFGGWQSRMFEGLPVVPVPRVQPWATPNIG